MGTSFAAIQENAVSDCYTFKGVLSEFLRGDDLPSTKILVAFCSEIPLICSSNRFGLVISHTISSKSRHKVRTWGNFNRSLGDIRVSHRLDGVVPSIDKQLNISPTQSRNALI